MNVFFKSQFSYCPLSWMFHSYALNNMINRLHERRMRIFWNANTSSFTDLLKIDNSVSVHHRNIQILATELYKFVNGLSPKRVNYCFKLNNMTVYNTKNSSTLCSQRESWHKITLPFATENLGTYAKQYEKGTLCSRCTWAACVLTTCLNSNDTIFEKILGIRFKNNSEPFFHVVQFNSVSRKEHGSNSWPNLSQQYVIVMSHTRFRVNLLSELPECQGNPCLKQTQYLKFKWQQRDSNPQSLSS